ncbi:MAG TPA: hypothetical protein VM871_10230 [Flavisolibacter sp.]|jgi:hypothetical protein|nr:hypothetical protein [Flavisolibacter sp.]
MRLIYFVVLTIVLSSCFLFKDYRKKEFAYTQAGQQKTLFLIAPKGYVKEEVKDTAGIRLHTFQYPGGALLYAAYLTDTTYELQSYNKDLHQPIAHGQGGLVYKGQEGSESFYREIRQGNFRFGYRGVPRVNETFFDSATNYAAWGNK